MENVKEIVSSITGSHTPEDTNTKDNRHHQWIRAELSLNQLDKLKKQRNDWLEEHEKSNEFLDKIITNLIKTSEIHLSHAYLPELSNLYTPEKMDGELSGDRIQSFEITKWVMDTEEDSIEKLSNFYQAFSKDNCNVALIINRKKDCCQLYISVCNTNESTQGTISNNLRSRAENCLCGNFPGTIIEPDKKQEVHDLLKPNKYRNVAIISSLASEKSEKFVSQTIEKLLDGMRPKDETDEYTLMMLAQPISNFEEKECTISNTYTALSPFSSIQKNTTINESLNISSTATKGLSVGGGVSMGVGMSAGVPGTGVSVNVGAYAHVDGHWDSSMSETETVGKAEGTTLSFTNYRVKYVLDLLEKSMKRLEQCKSTGMWNYATYVISDDAPMLENVAHMYSALIQGKDSYLEESAVNIWDCEDENATQTKQSTANEILESLSRLQHPTFALKEYNDDTRMYPLVTDATNCLSTIELAHAMNMPRKSVSGLPVVECASFGRNVSLLDGVNDSLKIEIGDIWHMRQKDGGKLEIDTNLLTSHVFITGSTGSGKSNTVYQLLDKLGDKKFLVIEPTKGEYKKVFGGREGVYVYGTNPSITKLLRINPFSFPEGIQLYAHLDRLIEIFNACWPMYAAMPAVLKDAIERAYVEAGWNLRTSQNKKYGRLFPTFVDVLRQIDIVMNESDYSGDSKGDYKGALKTRLKSLTNGIYSLIFGYDELSDRELFENNVIVDLSEIGTETTSLAMGMLVLKLQEYRMANGTMNSDLNHITVLEEAHNLLKRTSTEQTSEGANLVGKSVEMITNAIAEMRTYGECFMIVDQAPGALDPAAIRNTNTKIVLRLPDYSDRELVGKSIGLNDNQIVELGKLERGVAAVYQSGWIESVLCKFEKYSKDESFVKKQCELSEFGKAEAELCNAIILGDKYSDFFGVIKGLKYGIVKKSSLPVSVKCIVCDACDLQTDNTTRSRLAYILFNAESFTKELHEYKPEVEEKKKALENLIARKAFEIYKESISYQEILVIIQLLRDEQIRRENQYIIGVVEGGVR